MGFDYGTHSTKILVRRRGNDFAEVLCLEDPVEGYPWFASPSLVCVDDGHLYFGGAALRRTSGVLHRSLKVRLLAPDPSVSDGKDRETDLLVAAYLSWAFARVARALDSEFGLANLRVLLNVAAPMNHVEDPVLKARYLRIVQAAWKSVFGDAPHPVEDGASLEAVEHGLRPHLEPDTAVEDAAERPFDVLPETIAPIVSLSRSPKMAPGFYLMMDMGAGTTEVSICHVNESGADQRVLCYEDTSEVIGGDDFDRLDRESGGDVQALVDKAHKLVWKTWGLGYRKDAGRPALARRWKQVQLIASGGGARREELLHALAAHKMVYWPPSEVGYSFDWHEPQDIHGAPPRSSTWGDDRRLLAVADGLSIHRRQWPVHYDPADVQVQPRSMQIEHLEPDWYQGL